MELTRAILFVRDLDRMTLFYGQELGLRLLPERSSEGWVEFAAGAATLGLHAIPANVPRDPAPVDPPRAREETPIKLVFLVTNVTEERERLLARGVRMFDLRPWGACDGIDPEGNVFQIAQPYRIDTPE